MKVLAASQMKAGEHRAHAINITKTAGGFIRLGHETLLCCRPTLNDLRTDELATNYGEPDLNWAFYPESTEESTVAALGDEAKWNFAEWVVKTASDWGADLIYARDFYVSLLGAERGISTILETHAHLGEQNPMLLSCLRATAQEKLPLTAIVTISSRLRDYFIECGGLPEKVSIIPDGVDLEMFLPPRTLGTSPFDNPIRSARVVYSGHLYDYKGIPTILEAANVLPDISFELLGGLPEDIERTQEQISRLSLKNVFLHGIKPHSEVPPYLWDADLLLLPPSAKDASAAWTSPVKLGEYLASGTPLIASRILALQDWLDEDIVHWFEPDNGDDLANVISEALTESEERRDTRRKASHELAKKFSYKNRAQKILAAGMNTTR